VITPSALADFNLTEVVKSVTRGGFYVSTFFLVMNRDRWESLDAEGKALVDDMGGEPLSVKAARTFEEADEKGIEQAGKKGVEFYALPPAELARWKAATRAVADQWVGDTQARGLPAREFYERMAALARA
jgi:TRAP-type transport system periplasmic protein